MNRRRLGIFLLLAGLMSTSGVIAQTELRPRNRGGSGGQPVDTYTVVAIDTDARTLQLRATDGTVSKVKVPEDVFDLSTLNVGDRIQVNFLVPQSSSDPPRASSIWPVK